MKNNILMKKEILGKKFRIFGSIEEPLFLAIDIAKWIEHSDPNKMLKILDEDEIFKKKIKTK